MKTLYKTIIATSCILHFALCNSSAQSPAASLFYRLRDKVNTVKDYTADVRVKIDVGYMKVPMLAGTLYFKLPGKLRLERKGGISILPKKNVTLTMSELLPGGTATIIDAGYDSVAGRRVHVIKVVPEGESDIILTKLWVDEARMVVMQASSTSRDNGTVQTVLEWGKFINLNLPDRVTFILDVKDYKLPKGATMDYDDGTAAAPQTKSDGKPKKGRISITYLSYQVNTGLSDAVFNKPAQ